MRMIFGAHCKCNATSMTHFYSSIAKVAGFAPTGIARRAIQKHGDIVMQARSQNQNAFRAETWQENSIYRLACPPTSRSAVREKITCRIPERHPTLSTIHCYLACDITCSHSPYPRWPCRLVAYPYPHLPSYCNLSAMQQCRSEVTQTTTAKKFS